MMNGREYYDIAALLSVCRMRMEKVQTTYFDSRRYIYIEMIDHLK